MRRRVPSAAKALLALTAAGLVLSGCHYYRPYHGGPHYAAPSHGYQHPHGKQHRPEQRRHRGHRGDH